MSPDERARHSARFTRWRMSVFRRDRFRCQVCGQQGGTLNPHHIRMWARYPKLRFVVDNGITLCVRCHEKTFGHEEEMASRFEKIIKRKKNAGKQRIRRLKAKQNKSLLRRLVLK